MEAVELYAPGGTENRTSKMIVLKGDALIVSTSSDEENLRSVDNGKTNYRCYKRSKQDHELQYNY